MAISYVNTTEVENISKEVVDLSNELTTEFNNLFSRFSEVSNITREWVGKQSQFYFKKVANDKEQYLNFAEEIRNMAYKLNKDMIEINACIRTNNADES